MPIFSLFSTTDQRRDDTIRNIVACSWFALCFSTIVLLIVTVLQVVLVYKNVLPYEIQIMTLFFSSLFHFFMTVFISLLVLSKLKPENPVETRSHSIESQRNVRAQGCSSDDNLQHCSNLQVARNISNPPPYDNNFKNSEFNECKSASSQTPSRRHEDLHNVYSEPIMYSRRNDLLHRNSQLSNSFTRVSRYVAVQQARQMDNSKSDINSEASSDVWESSNENELRETSTTLMRRIQELKNNPGKLNTRENVYANLPYALKNICHRPEIIDDSDSNNQSSVACSHARGEQTCVKLSSPGTSRKHALPETRKIAREVKETVSQEGINSFSKSMSLESSVNRNENWGRSEGNITKLSNGSNLAAKQKVIKENTRENTLFSGKSTPNLNSQSLTDTASYRKQSEDFEYRTTETENFKLSSSFKNSNMGKSDAALFQARSQIHKMNEKILQQYAGKTRLGMKNSLHASVDDKISPKRLPSIEESIELSHDLPKNIIRF